jgi:rhodanese-related sulfurtransferase
MQSLLKPEYINSIAGSNLAELERAALDHGLYAVSLSKLTISALRTAECPLILHVRGDESIEYDHWVLFIGISGSKAQLLDGGALHLVVLSELNANWDGNALAVSSHPIDSSRLRSIAHTRMVLAGFLTLILAGTSTLLRRKEVRSSSTEVVFRLSVVQGALLLVVTSIASAAYHRFSSDGLLQHPTLIRRFQQANFDTFPRLTAADVNDQLLQKAVIIDARFPADFAQGHVKGAVNLPVSATPDECQQTLDKVDRGQRIIVYCQSETCPFARKMAGKLSIMGFTNIAIFPGGWIEWEEHLRVTGSRRMM